MNIAKCLRTPILKNICEWLLSYASLQIFLNFLIMKKQQKRNKIIYKIVSSNISKSSKKKGKRNSPRFWIRPEQTGSWWDNFCAGQKVSEEWKEMLCISQENFEKLCTELRPYILEHFFLSYNWSRQKKRQKMR